jgi:16S rRNA (guanine(966)-N(2))-methyltransferase RsmD
MRILAGEAKGQTLRTREGKGTRPTDSRSREMLFNILGERVPNAMFIDLYAGTGSVGLEALSRGAQFCVFIEQNAVACKVIKENLRLLGFGERAQVWNTTIKAALKRLVEDEKRFDIIFADPPFNNPNELKDLSNRLDNASQLLHNVARQTATSPPMSGTEFAPESSSDDTEQSTLEVVSEPKRPALLVIQHHRKAQPTLGTHYKPVQERRAGESTLSFYELADEDSSFIVETPDVVL